jgi:hypothetical protein
MAMAQARCHPPAQALTARRREGGDSGREAMWVLKRRRSDVIYAALRAGAITTAPTAPGTRPGHKTIQQRNRNTADTGLTLDPS